MKATGLRPAHWGLSVLVMALASLAWTDGVTHRIHFPRGSTAITLHGTVVRGDRDTYVLRARAQQTMRVRLTSLEQNAVFQLYQPGKHATVQGAGEGEDATVWSGTVPVTGDYTIVVGATRGNTSYTLAVSIE